MTTQSGKQEGLSNTDTKHSTNITDNPEKSTKGGTYIFEMTLLVLVLKLGCKTFFGSELIFTTPRPVLQLNNLP